MEKFVTRMGDGFRVEMTEAEIRRNIEEATQDASKRAKVPPLTEDEMKYWPENEVGVKKGNKEESDV